MPQHKAKIHSANETIRRRIQAWEDADPSTLLTKRIEKATEPLQWLVALLLPERLITEVIEKTLWAAEALTDREDVLKTQGVSTFGEVLSNKIERCDAHAEGLQKNAVAAAVALGAWDLAGPLGIAPSLASLFTLAFRTIKKIGLSYGFDTSKPGEELIVLQIFVAASTLYHRDKVQALKAIEKYKQDVDSGVSHSQDTVQALIVQIARLVGSNLTKRRALATVPALGALIGGSTNGWLVHDVGWAARNIYASRRFQLKSEAREKAKDAKEKEAQQFGPVSLKKAA
jgi:hypothetical protein